MFQTKLPRVELFGGHILDIVQIMIDINEMCTYFGKNSYIC